MPVVLSCTLVVGLLVSSASAGTIAELTTIDTVLGTVVSQDFKDYIIEGIGADAVHPNVIILMKCGTNRYPTIYDYLFGLVLPYGAGVYYDGSNLYVTQGSVDYYYVWTGSTGNKVYGGRTASSGSFQIDGRSYYLATPGANPIIDFYSSENIYTSQDGSWTYRNLDISAYTDTRQLNIWKSVDYPESSNPLEYINVSTDADLNQDAKIRFDYTDADGLSQYKVFGYSDFHDITSYDNDGIWMTSWYIFPYLISSYEFTLTEATFYSQYEWASMTVELDLTFNEGEIYPLPNGWNDTYYISQYFESNSNGRLSYGRASIEYKVVGIYTYWTDGDLVCWQNFDVKGLFIPDFLTSDFQNNLDMQEVYSIFEQYDVIFTDCIEAEIDGICGQYVYHNTHDVFLQQGFIPSLRFLISQGIIQQHRSLPLSVDSSGLSTYDNLANGFIVTRTFLLKRALSALGDVDDRLLEFETNLVGEDSLGVSLQTKLDNLLLQQNTFFEDVNRFFQKLDYGLTGVEFGNIERYLHDIWESLVGEFSFDFEVLEHPWIDIYHFCKGLFDDGLRYLDDFNETANAILNGSEFTSLPVPSLSVTPALPFYPSVTPIPIPTLGGG